MLDKEEEQEEREEVEEKEEEEQEREEVEENVIRLQLRHSDVGGDLLTAKQMRCLNISGLLL